MNALLLLLAALPQGAPAAATADDARWLDLDRVVMVVNTDPITLSQLRQDLQRAQRTRRITSETEMRAAESQILGERVRDRLRVQAGGDLGLDEKAIDARVKENLERLRQRENGTVGLSRFLQSRDISAQDAPRLFREDILSQTWVDGVTGEGVGPLGRRAADTWVRPGRLPALYRDALERPGEIEALGGSVAKLRFQQILLDVQESGGREAAATLARALKARIEAGEDMTALVHSYGVARDTDGIGEVEEVRLRELFPEVYAFTSRAQPGQVSDPIEGTLSGKQFLRIVRLLERTEARTPDLGDPTVQQTLLERARKRAEDARLEAAYTALLRSSYVWPPEYAGRARN